MRALWCSSYSDCFLHDSLHGSSSIPVSSQRMGWSSVQAFSAMADLLMKPLMHESLCSIRSVLSRRVVSPMYLSAGAWHFVDNICLLLCREGAFDLNEERIADRSGCGIRRMCKDYKQANVTYGVPFTCGKVYIGKTTEC